MFTRVVPGVSTLEKGGVTWGGLVKSVENGKRLSKKYINDNFDESLRDVLTKHFHKHLRSAKVKAGAQRDKIEARIDSSVKDITDYLIQSKNKRFKGWLFKRGSLTTEFKQRVQNAARTAELTIKIGRLRARIDEEEARAERIKPEDLRPQIVGSAGRFNLLIPVAKAYLENLMARGGAAKVPSFLRELAVHEEFGRLDNVKHWLGCSSGSTIAVLSALGMSASGLEKELGRYDGNVWLKTTPGFHKRYPTFETKRWDGPIGRFVARMLKLCTGGNTVEILDKLSSYAVVGYLQGRFKTADDILKSPELDKLGLTAQDKQRLAKLWSQKLPEDLQKDRTELMITDLDTRILCKLDPQRFSEVTVDGCEVKTGKAFYFGTKNASGCPLAFLARLSASLGPVLDHVLLDPGDGLGKRAFTDGGLADLVMGSVIFGPYDPKAPINEQLRLKSGLVTYADGQDFETAPIQRILYNKKVPQSPKPSLMQRLFFPRWDPKIVQTQDEQTHRYGVNTFVARHRGLNVSTFNPEPGQLKNALLEAEVGALEESLQRTNMAAAWSLTVASNGKNLPPEAEKFAVIKRAAELLSPEQKEQMLQSPPDKNEQKYKDNKYASFEYDLALYQYLDSSRKATPQKKGGRE